LELLHHAADDLGYLAAVAELGRMYSYGDLGAPEDKTKGRKYLEDAVKMGDVSARCTLACIEDENGNIKLAIRHWKLAAEAGHSFATEKLWKTFYKGNISKETLEAILRAHKEACDAMNSEERERSDLLQKAMADNNDVFLIGILGSYYGGDIKAKELNKALKAHQG